MEGQQELFAEAVGGEVADSAATAGETVAQPVTDSSQAGRVQAEAAQQVVRAFKGWSASTPTGRVFWHGTGNESPFGGPPPPYHGFTKKC